MSHEAPTAQGAFAKTPLPHLLVYALERQLSGTFELTVAGASVATMLVYQGFPAKLRLRAHAPALYLGEVMTSLGLIGPEAHAAATQAMQAGRLYGEALLQAGAATEATLTAGLRAQLERKLEHLFTLPPETEFSYFDGKNGLADYGGNPVAADPLPVVWRGVQRAPSLEHVEAALQRVGTAPLRLGEHAQLGRFAFGPNETSVLAALERGPQRIVDLASSPALGPGIAQLLVYLLVITKQVELIDDTNAQTNAQTSGVQASGVQADATAPPSPRTLAARGAPQGAQAFARVQLQAKSVARMPLVVEERAAAHNASDARIASPTPQALSLPPAVVAAARPQAASNLDIQEMISASLPPGAPDPSIPPPAASVTSSQPPPLAELSAEHAALKAKIVERAAAISSQDYFQMLGIARDAAPEVVQRAFITLAKVWHPDRLPLELADVRDECGKVFSHVTEAHATLSDAERRAEYMTLLKDGGATPDDQAKIQAILEAATEFQKAEVYLKRNDVAQAYELAKKAHTLDPEQADYLALMTWIEAQRAEWTGREKTLEKIAVLDRCIKMNVHCERAHFWRGMLYKRIDENVKAVRDFKKASELNPRNLDAMREVRLHNMRGGTSTKPPPSGGSTRTSQRPQAPEPLGGLLGKLFKK